jgi:hypothetical protein
MRGNLIDGTFDGRELDGIAGGEQVDAGDGDAIGELFDILSRTRQAVKVVQIGEGAEEGFGSQLSVSNDQTMFPRALNLKHLNHRAYTPSIPLTNPSNDDQRGWGTYRFVARQHRRHFDKCPKYSP